MTTYKTPAEANAEQASLRRLRDAIKVSKTSLRLDECGAWHLKGTRGAIYGDGRSGWLIYIAGRSPRHWTEIKKRLSFLSLAQDGDEDGVLILSKPPTTATQAAAVRKAAGLRLSPRERGGFSVQDRRNAPRPGHDLSPLCRAEIPLLNTPNSNSATLSTEVTPEITPNSPGLRCKATAPPSTSRLCPSGRLVRR